MPFIERYYKLLALIFCVVFAVQMWLCSGTLAPYAATLANPHIVNNRGEYFNAINDSAAMKAGCYYIANYDHKHYLANYSLVDGQPKEEWNWAHLLRRPLLFIISYPLMKMFGFTGGGFIMAILINITVMVWFAAWVRKRWGTLAALTALPLLCAYPATMYWSGQPYPHILITACTLALTTWLYKIYETTSVKQIAVYSLCAGISFLAYDTYIFFIPAFMLLLLWQKKWLALPVSLFMLVLPLGLWLWFLHGKTLPGASGNTDIYSNIINAYLHNFKWDEFWRNLLKLPTILYNNFIDAAYFYMAVFFAVTVIAGLITRKLKPELPFWVIALSLLVVFVFNNMAPYYNGWHMRGIWIARIYQPAFILCLLPAFYVIKNAGTNFKWLPKGLMMLAMVVFILNSWINIAPATGNDSQAFRHYNFYKHSAPGTMHENLEKYGRRPLGICH